MIGTLAQQVALISYGNEFLKSGELQTQFYLNNSTFQFCSNVNIINLKRIILSLKYQEVIIARSPNDWFLLLRKEKCKKMRLYYQHSKESHQDHKLAAFVGGGGTWLIETIYERHSDCWGNRWEVTNSNAPDKKIWSVKYVKVLKRQETTYIQYDLEKVKANLSHILEDIARFARKHDLLHWADTFDKAYRTLSSSNPNEEYYHKDLIVDNNYKLIAKQVLFSAGIAWVFGGMGSWNDMGFIDKEDNNCYEKLSAQLYKNICEAIVCAINSY